MTAQEPRFVPVARDLRALGLRKGDLLSVVPLEYYRGDAVYLISVEGEPIPFRCNQDGRGRIQLRSLEPRGGSAVMTHAEFGEVLLGQVLAACKVLDPSLLPQPSRSTYSG